MLDSRNHFLPQRRVTRILHLQGTAISSPTPAHFILTVEQNDNACKKPRLTQKIMKPFEGAAPAMMAPFWQAMHSLSIFTARALGEAVDFGGFRKLLDVGGGSGAFDIELSACLQTEAMRSYCLAVRSALTDDGHPPLCASGLKLHDRLTQISDSLARVEEKRGHFLRP